MSSPTPALYEYIDDNPVFEFQPNRFTNNPAIIAQNDRMVAVNAALEGLHHVDRAAYTAASSTAEGP